MAKENSADLNRSVTIDIREIPNDFYGLGLEPWMIHRVPRKLRKVNESAYTPQLISIGPYHHGSPDLHAMESRKQKYYAEFCKRVNKDEADLKSFIQIFIRKIRNSYEEETIKSPGTTQGLDEEVFEEMVLRDACFIVELLLRNYDEEARKKDYILHTPWLRKAIKLDLILLENQLPFFALKELYNHVIRPWPLFPTQEPKCNDVSTSSADTTSSNDNPPVLSCNCVLGPASFTCCSLPKFDKREAQTKNPTSGENSNSHIHPLVELSSFFFEEHFLMTDSASRVNLNDIKDIKHFTDLLRQFWLPREIMSDKKTFHGDIAEHKYLYTATKLDTAGVTFAPARKERSATDLKIFKKPVLKFVPAINCMLLKIPELKIEDDTECLLRNVMALEQCAYPAEDYICGYVALMDQLINTRDDVDFLVEKKILTNLLGSSKEAAKLFNGLCCQIPRDKSYYARFYNELNAFYENRWNVTRATLKKVYFKDLWTGSSTVVGLFVLLFTISATTRKVYF